MLSMLEMLIGRAAEGESFRVCAVSSWKSSSSSSDSWRVPNVGRAEPWKGGGERELGEEYELDA